MKRIFLFIPLFFCLISFNSQAEIVDKQQYKYRCSDANTNSLLGYSFTAQLCSDYASQSSNFHRCVSSPTYYSYNSVIRCNTETSETYLVKIFSGSYDYSCPTSHQYETSDGQCSNDIGDLLPKYQGERGPNGCYPPAYVEELHFSQRSDLSGYSACYPDNCSYTIKNQGTAVDFPDAPPSDKYKYDRVSTGNACTYDASNAGWSKEDGAENKPDADYTPSSPIVGDGVDSGSLDSDLNPISGASSTVLYESQLTNENIKTLIKDQATLLTDANKSLNASNRHALNNGSLLQQIASNTKNNSSGGGGASSGMSQSEFESSSKSVSGELAAEANEGLGSFDDSYQDQINEAQDSFVDQVTNPSIAESTFDLSGHFQFGGGGCIPFQFTTSYGDLTLDQHCEPMEDFVQPTLKWFLYLSTMLYIYRLFNRTVRSL